MSELRPNIGYRAAAVTIKTIQSLHGWSRAKPERKRTLVRELVAAASLERAGYAEVCVIAPQNPGTEHQVKPAPVPHRAVIQSDRQRIGHASGLQQPPISRKCHFSATGLRARQASRQALSNHPSKKA